MEQNAKNIDKISSIDTHYGVLVDQVQSYRN